MLGGIDDCLSPGEESDERFSIQIIQVRNSLCTDLRLSIVQA